MHSARRSGVSRDLCYRVPTAPTVCMATCPRCKGHLTDSHRCPRRPLVVGVEITLAGLAGALVGLIVAAITVPQGRLIVDHIAMLVGALAGVGIDRYVRG